MLIAESPFLHENKYGTLSLMKESAMVIIDGSFLLGLAAVLSSIATLWRALRDRPAPNDQLCRKMCRRPSACSMARLLGQNTVDER
jgi:hypothetical protein